MQQALHKLLTAGAEQVGEMNHAHHTKWTRTDTKQSTRNLVILTLCYVVWCAWLLGLTLIFNLTLIYEMRCMHPFKYLQSGLQPQHAVTGARLRAPALPAPLHQPMRHGETGDEARGFRHGRHTAQVRQK